MVLAGVAQEISEEGDEDSVIQGSVDLVKAFHLKKISLDWKRARVDMRRLAWGRKQGAG